MTDTPIPAHSMHRIPVCCNYNCDEGRTCPLRADALALNQTDGGTSIDTAPVTAEGTIGATGETFIGLCFIAAVSVITWLAWTNWELLATAFGF